MYKFKDQKEYNFAWQNNGLLPTGETISMQDAIATPEATLWLPKVIENTVKEAVEPVLMGTSLLTRIEYHFGQTISFPAVGALEAADIAEGQAYPEKRLSMGGSTVTATIGKSGLAVKITDEMVRWSQFDIVAMHLRAAGNALARHKEKKIFNYIKAMGVVTHDNLNPTSSVYGVTTGRALDGSANGSIIMDNLFDAYAQVLLQGFTPDTLLMHPLTWAMWVKDPVLRTIALMGGANVWFSTFRGSPAGRAPWSNGSQGKLGTSGGQDIIPGGNAGSQTATPVTGYPQTLTSAPGLPSYFPFPFRILVSPFVQFNPSTRLTDIMLFDSQELGALIVDKDVTVDQWSDPSVDIQKIKLSESYGIGIFNEGLGIAVMKNVKVVPNEVTLPAQTTISASGSVAAISATTALSL